MFRYSTEKTITINKKVYNPGDIIISKTILEDTDLINLDEEQKIIRMDRDPVKGMVDIIFVRYNLKEIEDKAIECIKQNTDYPNYQIIDFDNFKTKQGLSKLWNKLIEKSKADYICLLNTDAFVTTGWLTEMMKAFNDPMVAAVGPSGDNVGGIQRRVGTKQESMQYLDKFVELRQLSGFCFLIKKSLFKKVGEFPESVPFYGGESSWCIMARRKGYKLMWAQGSFVQHLCGQSVKKAGKWESMRNEGIKLYAQWIQKTSPVLFTTYNRLEYTKKSLKALLESGCENIIVIDNYSTDGTREWLQKLNDKRLTLIFNDKNEGVAGAMNKFFKITEVEEFVGKVDNDTIVPKDWFADLTAINLLYSIDIIQAKHKILNSNFKTFDEWAKKMKSVKTIFDGNIYYSSYVGGSGISIRREAIDKEIEKSEWVLGGWTQYQVKKDELKKAFYDKVYVDLLDMKADNEIDTGKYKTYYEETRRVIKDVKEIKSEDYNFKHFTSIETLDAIISRIDKKFAYLRYGDGELLCMDGWPGRKDYQLNSPELQRELRESIIDDPDYLISSMAGIKNEPGMKPGLFARFEYDNKLQKILADITDKREFYSPIALHYLLVFYPDKFKNLIDELKNKKVGFVGNSDMKGMVKILGAKEFICVPKIQAYQKINKYYPKILEMAKNVDIICLSAGIAATVIQKRLWIQSKVSTIDLGSVSDALLKKNITNKAWINIAKVEIDFKALRFTGERVIPIKMEEPRLKLILNQHLARYVFAFEHCIGKKVLDAACGTGYGSQFIKASLGVDNSKETIKYAKDNYPGPKFEVCDLNKEFPKGEFDIITSFETIEHLDNPDFFLENVKKSCKKLIFSIPLGDDSRPFHKIAYTDKSAREFMEKYFNHIEWFEQEKTGEYWIKSKANKCGYLIGIAENL